MVDELMSTYDLADELKSRANGKAK
jgi:hypothetical protein